MGHGTASPRDQPRLHARGFVGSCQEVRLPQGQGVFRYEISVCNTLLTLDHALVVVGVVVGVVVSVVVVVVGGGGGGDGVVGGVVGGVVVGVVGVVGAAGVVAAGVVAGAAGACVVAGAGVGVGVGAAVLLLLLLYPHNFVFFFPLSKVKNFGFFKEKLCHLLLLYFPLGFDDMLRRVHLENMVSALLPLKC